MNKHNHAAVLAIAARLTGYPSESFREELEEIREISGSILEEGPVQAALARATEGLMSLSPREVQEQYVSAFDLKDRTGLYLTAHEYGDSRKRGVALLELREYIRSHGFEPLEGELPDYMPMLFELAAEVEDGEGIRHLMDRLAYATQRIRVHLPEENPYKPIFEVLMQNVFDAPTEDRMRELEGRREKPDLDPMPYPLMYK